MNTKFAKLMTIILGGIAVGEALFKLVELLTPILGYDFALAMVSIFLVPLALAGMAVEEAIRK